MNFPKYLMAFSALSVVVGVLFPEASHALTFNNAGFERGDFTGWTTSGSVSIEENILGI
jgi:hypothetical protein